MGTKMPRPLPGTDEAGFEKMVNKFKAMLRTMKLSPFNREIWSKGTFWSGGSDTPAPAMPPAPSPKIIPGETEHKRPHRPRGHDKTPTTYDQYSKFICSQFGVCDYPNDEEAAHREAPDVVPQKK
jgi:hypothetical protein